MLALKATTAGYQLQCKYLICNSQRGLTHRLRITVWYTVIELFKKNSRLFTEWFLTWQNEIVPFSFPAAFVSHHPLVMMVVRMIVTVLVRTGTFHILKKMKGQRRVNKLASYELTCFVSVLSPNRTQGPFLVWYFQGPIFCLLCSGAKWIALKTFFCTLLSSYYQQLYFAAPMLIKDGWIHFLALPPKPRFTAAIQ